MCTTGIVQHTSRSTTCRYMRVVVQHVATYAGQHGRRACLRALSRALLRDGADDRTLRAVPVQIWRGGSPVPDVAGMSPVPVQMWQGQAQSRCRCGRGEPSPRADVAGMSPVHEPAPLSRARLP